MLNCFPGINKAFPICPWKTTHINLPSSSSSPARALCHHRSDSNIQDGFSALFGLALPSAVCLLSRAEGQRRASSWRLSKKEKKNRPTDLNALMIKKIKRGFVLFIWKKNMLYNPTASLVWHHMPPFRNSLHPWEPAPEVAAGGAPSHQSFKGYMLWPI